MFQVVFLLFSRHRNTIDKYAIVHYVTLTVYIYTNTVYICILYSSTAGRRQSDIQVVIIIQIICHYLFVLFFTSPVCNNNLFKVQGLWCIVMSVDHSALFSSSSPLGREELSNLLSFFHFILLFWNQILICRSVRHNEWAISILRLLVRYRLK